MLLLAIKSSSSFFTTHVRTGDAKELSKDSRGESKRLALKLSVPSAASSTKI